MVSVVFSGFLTCFCRVSVVFLWFLSFSRGFWTMGSKLGRPIDKPKHQNPPKPTGKHRNMDAPASEIRIATHARGPLLSRFPRDFRLIWTTHGHQFLIAVAANRPFSPGVSVHFASPWATNAHQNATRSGNGGAFTVHFASADHLFQTAMAANHQFPPGVSVHFGSPWATNAKQFVTRSANGSGFTADFASSDRKFPTAISANRQFPPGVSVHFGSP